MKRTSGCIVAVGGLVALSGPSAVAQQFELRNDSLVPGGTVAIQLGFVDNEIGAAVFHTPTSMYPLWIKRVQIFWTSIRGNSTNNIQDGILIYRGGGGTGGLSLVYESDPVQLFDGALNEVNIQDEQVIIQAPAPDNRLTIGLRFLSGPNGNVNAASLVTDIDGCQFGRNLIYSVGGLFVGWADPCIYGISGDFVIRAIVETVATCYPDCDQSSGPGVLDILDFLCFGNRFQAGDPYACDCDTATGMGVCDVLDFLCFGNRFHAGCQ